MTKLMRWIRRSMLHVAGEPGRWQTVDHVDGTRLADTHFWSSASMRFDDTPLDNFCETLPTLSSASPPARRRSESDRPA